MPGPQYFQNPFYDWDTFTGAMSSLAQGMPGLIGYAARAYANQPQQGGMPQQPVGNTIDVLQGYNQFPEYAARHAMNERGLNNYSVYADPGYAAYKAVGQSNMPYVDYDPNYMRPMNPFMNGYFQEVPQESAVVRQARQGMEASFPQLEPWRRPGYVRDVEK